MPHEPVWHLAVAAFAIAAAILLVGGWIVLRFQRDRQHFRLMQTALERGITTLPGMIPPWVVSLRQGVLALVLGLGILGAGIAIHATAAMIEPAPEVTPPPPPPTSAATLPEQPPASFLGQGPGNPGGPLGRWNDGRPHEGPPPPPMMREEPPRPSPALERWHQIQSQHVGGLLAICVGGILSLLGIARIAFARMERKYTAEMTGPGR